MTLSTVPEYDPDRITAADGRAVVIGGSVAGLVTAHVLADRFEAVTVVERDPLIEGPTSRPGVPQDRHIHVLHEAGRSTLEDFFPGYGDDLLASGAMRIDLHSEFDLFFEGDYVADGPDRMPMYCATRPLFEETIRRRVADRGGVDVRTGSLVTDFLVDAAASAVEGVVVREPGLETETLEAELVVDAAGRTSRTPRWLEDYGYPAPDPEEVHVDVGYSTLELERPAGDRRAFVAMPSPSLPRGGLVFPVEGGRWLMTLQGVNGDHPPTDVEGFEAFAGSLPVDGFARLLEEATVVSREIDHYPFPSNHRYHYEDLERFPEGLCVVGDAIASFNPVYGQGMSIAALEAVQLHRALASGGVEGLALRFFDRIERLVDDAWRLAVGADFRFPQTTGPKPRGTDLFNRYLTRLTRKAHSDEVLADSLTRVITMERPPTSLFRPGLLWRVLKPARRPG